MSRRLGCNYLISPHEWSFLRLDICKGITAIVLLVGGSAMGGLLVLAAMGILSQEGDKWGEGVGFRSSSFFDAQQPRAEH